MPQAASFLANEGKQLRYCEGRAIPLSHELNSKNANEFHLEHVINVDGRCKNPPIP